MDKHLIYFQGTFGKSYYRY